MTRKILLEFRLFKFWLKFALFTRIWKCQSWKHQILNTSLLKYPMTKSKNFYFIRLKFPISKFSTVPTNKPYVHGMKKAQSIWSIFVNTIGAPISVLNFSLSLHFFLSPVYSFRSLLFLYNFFFTIMVFSHHHHHHHHKNNNIDYDLKAMTVSFSILAYYQYDD